LTAFQRGPLSDSGSDGVPDTVTNDTRSQDWGLDALGNWTDTYIVDNSMMTSEQYRTHNRQNQLTELEDLSTSLDVTLTYDGNGNMSGDEDEMTLVYDGWNRLVGYKDESTTLVGYEYDALNRRIEETASGTTTDLYYSTDWQVLEEQVSGVTKAQYVWSPVYVDAMVLRDRDADNDPGTGDYGETDSGLEQRLYVQQDHNYNVTALTDTSGAVQQRMVYDAYGAATFLTACWSSGSNTYNWKYLHQGGRYDSVTGLYHFRNRDYSATLGRWTRQDPAGYVDGGNLYEYVATNPLAYVDPDGNQTIGPPASASVPGYADAAALFG
jgi:RHS repeat-associated protein